MDDGPDGFLLLASHDAFSSGVTKKRLQRLIPKGTVKHNVERTAFVMAGTGIPGAMEAYERFSADLRASCDDAAKPAAIRRRARISNRANHSSKPQSRPTIPIHIYD